MADRAPAIGFVGLGHMGYPMATRIAAAGHSLAVYDLREEVTAAFAKDRGATAAADLPSLASSCDLIITCLPTAKAVSEAVLGDSGLRPGLKAGALVVDMSSSNPIATAALGEALRALGVRMLDAPVSGGVKGATAGTLAIMCGGEEDDLAAARPVLECLGSHVTHTGKLGTGHALKALNNLASGCNLLIALEVLLAGKKFGLDPHVMVEVLNQSSGRNSATESKIEPFVLSRSFAAGFAIELMVKDIKNALALAEEMGTPMPLGEAVVETWARALETMDGSADFTTIAKWLEAQAPGLVLE